MRILAIALAGLVSIAAQSAPAGPQVALSSRVALVKMVAGPSGSLVPSYQEPKLVTPGDRLQFTLEYTNGSGRPADNFVVTDPIPSGVQFAGHESAGASVSVDGGKSYGPLGSLKVSDGAGNTRPAAAADVTHVRWTFAGPIAPGEHGELRFEAIVK